MKRNSTSAFLITTLLAFFSQAAFTQWSDTKNIFADSLHMPVSESADQQQYPLVVRSYPDSGYFFIWQDSRNTANGIDIFAQKFDKNGNALWAANGIPIASGPRSQHYIYAANVNHRNYSIAATDSAGGFYITYIDDSVTAYTWARIAVQNVLSDGSLLIPQGYMVAQTPSGFGYDFAMPQLIADGRKGFYISYVKNETGSQYVYAYNYKKLGGTFVQNGGGWLNEYARESQLLGPCGLYSQVTYYGMRVYDYHIWPDGQDGCNVVMNMGLVSDVDAIGFNRLCRVKKDCRTTVYRRTTDVADCDPVVTDYAKDDVVQLYKYTGFTYTMSCTSPGPPPTAYTQTSVNIENGGLGYQTLDMGSYDYYYVKGVTLPTSGNINADIIAFNVRKLIDFTVTPIVTRAFSRAVEKYDSLPYELCSNDYCYTAYRTSPEGKVLNKVNNINDTILSKGGLNFYEFNVAGSADRFYATALLWPSLNSQYVVYLQQLKLVQAGADTFAIQYNTPSHHGMVIGQNLSTGAGSSSISYGDPMVATDYQGNGIFYIRDYYRHTRVSPIINGYELSWGAMGRPTGTGIIDGYPYRPENPFLLLDPLNGTGVMAWNDDRTPPTTFFNIYTRRLDSLNVLNHLPPNKPVQTLFWGNAYGTPAVLLGTSKKYSVIEAYSSITKKYGPVVEILDDFNLGNVEVNVYYNGTTIRSHNGKPYLDRNYTIKVQNNPPSGLINLRLYFTNAEFDALKTADPTIVTPGHLAVVKQPNNTLTVPTTYTPIAGEEIIVPKGWSAVSGGYYIEFEVSGFSNFFLFKNENALPVTWVDVRAQWHNSSQAKVSWQVADEENVKHYTVQHSKDGTTFTDVCTVIATGSSAYSCIVPGLNDSKNYYRIKEVDNDANSSYSKIVLLNGAVSTNLITLYPNPASKVLNVQTSIDTREMTVVDGLGRNLLTFRVQNRISAIDVTRFRKGMYTLIMVDKNGTKYYRKFVVE